MNRRITRSLTSAACGLAVVVASAASVTSQAADPVPFTVHEWGTFTSIAGPDGQAETWQPLDGPQDLPCFVHRSPFVAKVRQSGTVRMETPVLYFYAPAPLAVDVDVTFRQGVITEWYPRATVTPSGPAALTDPAFAGAITWHGVTVRPGAAADFPSEPGTSHYYAARSTDAAPLEAAGERDRFLFYRGVGGFQPPIRVRAAGDTVVVNATAGFPLGDVILFQHRPDAMAYAIRRVGTGSVTFGPLVTNGEFVPPIAELQQMLQAGGLYPKEAKAMVDTWRDSWFEEGTRVIYIAPRPFVDATLPLALTPEPSAVDRVFVGRVEVHGDAEARAVADALSARDVAALVRFGRFLPPLASRVIAAAPEASRKTMADTLGLALTAALSAPACRAN
jgi:hypothetical protein